MIRIKLPCFPRAVPLECRGKREKWVFPRDSTEKSDTSINKVRVEQKWRKIDMTISHKYRTWEWEEREGRGRNQGKRHVGRMRQQQIQDPQIHQPNNSNQEWCTTRRNRERYDLWRNADELRNKNYYTPLQSTARGEDCKDKDPTKVIELYQHWLGTKGKGGGGSENKCGAMPCALRAILVICVFL